MAAATAAAIITAVAAVGGAVESREQAMTAEKDTKKARKIANARDAVRSQRAKQKLLAQARVQRATLEQAGQAAGATGSSSVLGAIGSTQSQAAETLGFQSFNTAANTQIAARQSSATSALNRGQQNAALFQAIGSGANLFADPERNKVFGIE